MAWVVEEEGECLLFCVYVFLHEGSVCLCLCVCG